MVHALRIRFQIVASYGEVLHVMDIIRKAGVTRVALVTVPIPGTPGAAK